MGCVINYAGLEMGWKLGMGGVEIMASDFRITSQTHRTVSQPYAWSEIYEVRCKQQAMEEATGYWSAGSIFIFYKP